jgi:hypothetical protein
VTYREFPREGPLVCFHRATRGPAAAPEGGRVSGSLLGGEAVVAPACAAAGRTERFMCWCCAVRWGRLRRPLDGSSGTAREERKE